jgi:hypothetical protein
MKYMENHQRCKAHVQFFQFVKGQGSKESDSNQVRHNPETEVILPATSPQHFTADGKHYKVFSFQPALAGD